MKISIGLEQKTLTQVNSVLQILLADEFLLYTKLRNFHWNIVGDNFMELHKFLEEQYDEVAEIKDEVAERIRTLGGTANGSMKEFLAETRLKEHSGEVLTGAEMLKVILQDHEQIIKDLRKDQATVEEFGDIGTNDFLVGLLQKHEKLAWMTRSFFK